MRTCYLCPACGSRVGGARDAGALVCGLCWTPLGPRDRRVRVAAGDPARARQRARRAVREDGASPGDDYAAAHPGHPLGAGMPPGATMRDDGETHLEAWMRVLRSDACAYCSEPGAAGTVDHVDYRRGPRRDHGLHSWTNLTGACERCNGGKGAERLLLWLARRRVLA